MKCLLLLSLLASTAAAAPDEMELFRRWRASPLPELRLQAVRSLRGSGGPKARAALLSLLDDEDAEVRGAVRGELLLRPAAELLDLTREVRKLRSAVARREGVRVLLARKGDVSGFARDRDPEVRARVLAAGHVDAKVLESCLVHRDPRTRALALETMNRPERAASLIRDRAEEVRIAVARIATGVGMLEPLLGDKSWRVRLAAVLACERLRLKSAVPLLIQRLDKETGRVAARCRQALESLTQVPFGADTGRWREWWRLNGKSFEVPKRRHRRSEDGASRASLQFHRIPIESDRICFVLDLSRSMAKPAPRGRGRSRWDLVREDLKRVLRKLPARCRFNVLLFRTGIEAWRPRAMSATKAAVAACLRWIDKAVPRGWTNLFDALERALALDEVDTVYVLSDGVPSVGRERTRTAILEEVAFLNRYRLVQINCIQAGGDKGLGKRWRGFFDDLARAHDGIAVRE